MTASHLTNVASKPRTREKQLESLQTKLDINPRGYIFYNI